MTDTNPMHDHYTVISRAGDVHTSRVEALFPAQLDDTLEALRWL